MDKTRICPACGSDNVFVTDSRFRCNAVYRRRRCGECNYRYSTFEVENNEYTRLKKIEKKFNSIKLLLDVCDN